MVRTLYLVLFLAATGRVQGEPSAAPTSPPDPTRWSAQIRTALLSPDKKMLLVAYTQHQLGIFASLWDVRKGQRIGNVPGLMTDVVSCGFLPDGNAVVVESSGLVTVFRIHEKAVEKLRSFSIGDNGYWRAISGDATILVALKAWDPMKGSTELSVWDLQKGAVIKRVSVANPGSYLFVSWDGRLALLADRGRGAQYWLWDVTAGKLIARFEGKDGWTRPLGIAKDNRGLLLCKNDTELCYWDIEQKRTTKTLKDDSIRRIHSVVEEFPKKKAWGDIIEGSHPADFDVATFWHLDTGKRGPSTKLTVRLSSAKYAFSQDGNWVVLCWGSNDQSKTSMEVHIWDMEKNKTASRWVDDTHKP